MPVQRNSSNLSLWSTYGRTAIKFGALGLVFLIVARFSLNIFTQIYLAINPPGPPPPTLGFGKLPVPNFPTQLAEERPSSLELETVGQQLPTFAEQVAVYYVPGFTADLLALDEAKQTAATLTFLFEPEKLSPQEYRWRRSQPFAATFEMNIVNKTFKLESDWASSITLLDQKFLPDEKNTATYLRTLLRSIDLTHPDIATSAPEVQYLKALAGQTKPASSLNEADFVQADLYRVTPNQLPTVTSQWGQGVIRAIFSGSREPTQRIIQFTSNYFPVNYQLAETYPLQPTRQAWSQLKSGQGYITNKGMDKAVIRSVYLAYYEPPEPDSYLQPVYVFEGDGGFQALVPALDPQIYQVGNN